MSVQPQRIIGGVICVLALAAAFILQYNGKGGWGWFLAVSFIALLCAAG